MWSVPFSLYFLFLLFARKEPGVMVEAAREQSKKNLSEREHHELCLVSKEDVNPVRLTKSFYDIYRDIHRRALSCAPLFSSTSPFLGLHMVPPNKASKSSASDFFIS